MLARTSDGTCLVLQDKHFARAETLAVVVVAVFASSAGAGKVIAVAALAELFSASQEALFRTRVCARVRLSSASSSRLLRASGGTGAEESDGSPPGR